MSAESTGVIEKQPAGETADTERTRAGRCYRPNVDILEKADELTLLADMPGVKGNDIDIHFENGALTIVGKVADRQPNETQYLAREYGIGDFSRTFQVSEAIDAERISAEFADGVLTLHLPKTAAVMPRKIAVKAK